MTDPLELLRIQILLQKLMVAAQCRVAVCSTGTDLTVYRALIEDPERLSDRLGREVRAGAPRKVAGQQIEILEEEEYCPCCLGSYAEDVPCS